MDELRQPEAEALIDSLKPFLPKEVGTRRWLRQHEYLQKLNTQAHVNAMSQRSEFVQELFLSLDKIPLLVHELLVIEMWTEKAYKKLKKVISKQPMTLHAVLYQESLLMNMLELFFYHKEVVTSLSEETLILLVDYCYRKLTYLNSLSSSDREELAQGDASHRESSAFRSSTFALSVTRFIIENARYLSLGVLHRLVVVHDFIEVLSPLLHKSPWTVVLDKGTKRYENGEWHDVSRKEMAKISTIEAQMWLAVYVLCTEPECLKKVNLTPHKREILAKLRSIISTTLVDQISILSELQRALDMLVVSQQSDTSGAFIEEVPQAWEALSRIDWDDVISHLMSILPNEIPSREELTSMVDVMTTAAQHAHLCALCGNAAEHRCSRCKNEWYCSRDCQVKAWKKHKKVCMV